MDRLDCINTFIAVVETGNFSNASRHLGITRDQVAKRICYLEAIFNTALFIRNTRKMHLTQSGDKFYQHSKVIMSEFEWAESEIFYEQKYPEGVLRINAPYSFSQTYLTDAISKFMDQYPNIKIDLFLTDHFLDIYEEKYDINLRLKYEVDHSHARLFNTYQRYFYATPAYFEKKGKPENLEELKQHEILLYSQTNQNTTLSLTKNKKQEMIYCTPKLTCNSGNFLLEFCKKDQGIIFLPEFLVLNDVNSGNIVRCLEDYQSPPLYFYALVPNPQRNPKKVDLFLDYLGHYFNKS